MNLVLKYPTCKKCGSHTYNSLGHGGEGDKYSMNCICGTLTKGVFTSKEVLPPIITFPNEEPKRYEKEREEFYTSDFGVNAEIIFDENSSYDNHYRNNCTEVHYLYGSFLGEQRIAFESDLHGTGGTLPVEHIKEIIITIADKLEKSY